MRLRTLIICFLCIFQISASVQAKTKVVWWHAMGGQLDQWVKDLASEFNQSQEKYEIHPVFKGSYAEVMNASISAFRAGKQPHIVQVYEVGTATMMAAKGAIYPVHELMSDMHQAFNQNAFLPAIKSYYSTAHGHMLSMPFNSSTAVFYYNKDAFVKAGLDPKRPPKTWEDVAIYAKKLQQVGYKCGFTTSWPSWVLLENMSAWHDKPMGTKDNGFDGLDTRFVFNSDFHQYHFAQLSHWQKEKIYDYAGRKSKGKTKFVTEHCAMFMSSSGALASIKSGAKFDFGVSKLPYWSSQISSPQNSIIGGATLWVLRGHNRDEYEGVAAFFAYLSSAEVASKSHIRTGYLPLTQAAYRLTKASGYYTKNPAAEIPIIQLTNKQPTRNSKGLRFGNFVQIRDIVEQELEFLWTGKKTAREALDHAVEKGNEVLEDFEKMYK